MLQRELGLFDADFICIQGADRVRSFWDPELGGRRYTTWWVKRSPYRSDSIGIAWRAERFKAPLCSGPRGLSITPWVTL